MFPRPANAGAKSTEYTDSWLTLGITPIISSWRVYP
jgi:hypothetical protein